MAFFSSLFFLRGEGMKKVAGIKDIRVDLWQCCTCSLFFFFSFFKFETWQPVVFFSLFYVRGEGVKNVAAIKEMARKPESVKKEVLRWING